MNCIKSFNSLIFLALITGQTEECDRKGGQKRTDDMLHKSKGWNQTKASAVRSPSLYMRHVIYQVRDHILIFRRGPCAILPKLYSTF